MVGLSGILAIIYFFLGIAGAIFFIANHEMMLGALLFYVCGNINVAYNYHF